MPWYYVLSRENKGTVVQPFCSRQSIRQLCHFREEGLEVTNSALDVSDETLGISLLPFIQTKAFILLILIN